MREGGPAPPSRATCCALLASTPRVASTRHYVCCVERCDFMLSIVLPYALAAALGYLSVFSAAHFPPDGLHLHAMYKPHNCFSCCSCNAWTWRRAATRRTRHGSCCRRPRSTKRTWRSSRRMRGEQAGVRGPLQTPAPSWAWRVTFIRFGDSLAHAFLPCLGSLWMCLGPGSCMSGPMDVGRDSAADAAADALPFIFYPAGADLCWAA